ncbi:uncharacterized protein LOC120937099 [Rana temporaria]|uniref:uncharacterized protein LOC120937099 n=1 Tax=Rana temporaria TaxID=8407 RepID=UPI001AADC8DF|nr:uncharacterized protein LOC120937099 [Rana temporaria]
MDRLRQMINKLGKRLSSNKLLKCVLLNTAVELFGCMNSPSFITPNQSYYWENFDHYPTLPGAYSQSPEFTDTALSTESLDTLQNLERDALSCTAADNDSMIDTEPQVTQQIFYFLVPVDLISHVVLQDYCDTEIVYDLLNCVQEIDITPSIAWDSYDLHESNKKKSCVLGNETIWTLDDGDAEISFSLNDLLSYVDGIDATPSIFWDSYDLHESNQEMSCAPENNWSTSHEEFCSYDDLMLMDASTLFEDREKPVSSTPWLCRRRKKCLELF